MVHVSLANIGSLNCPWCDLKIGPYARGVTFHVRTHGKNIQDLYDHIHGLLMRPKCWCKPECTEPVSWHGWAKGYSEYAHGHCSIESKKQGTQQRIQGLKDGRFVHWTHKPEHREIVDAVTKKRVEGWNAAYERGDIEPWSKGHTKNTHPTLAAMSEKAIGSKRHFNGVDQVISELQRAIGDRFELLTDGEFIANRQSSKTCFISLRCTRCDRTTHHTVTNVVRKQKHRCETCDPMVYWVSKGENEMAITLGEMYGKVKRWLFVNGWSIDAYVPTIDTYFQFDGVYWHGLDRPLEGHPEPKIVKKHATDIEQNAWFLHHGIRLVRMTDVEWETTGDKKAFLSERVNGSSSIKA